MYLPILLTSAYWFSLYTPPLSRLWFWVLTTLYLIFLLVGILAGRAVISKTNRDKVVKVLLQKIATFGYSFSLVGLVLIFLRQQEVQFFGMRILAWSWWLICLVWLIVIVKFAVLELPKLKADKQKKQEFYKYL